LKIPELTDNIKELCTITDLTERLKFLSSTIQNIIDIERLEGSVLGFKSDFNTDTINEPFATCFAKGIYHQRPLQQCTATIDQKLSIIQYLPCSGSNRHLLRLISTSNKYLNAHIHAEDEDKDTKLGISQTKLDLAQGFYLLSIL